jgi:hypothetical protein
MAKIETELMKEMRGLRKEVSLVLRRQDLMLKAIIPEVKPTMGEVKIIKARKEFGSEKDLFKALG